MDNIEEDFVRRKHLTCITDSKTSIGSKVTGQMHFIS